MADPTPKSREERTEILKGIIKDLHAGADIEGLKQRFADLIKDVEATEIARMEQRLVEEGMPPEQIKKLCDVHVEVFRESLERQKAPNTQPGHPVHTFRAENEALTAVADEFVAALEALGSPPTDAALESGRDTLRGLLDQLMTVDAHYLRKENQLFPFLEKHGVSGPTQVMWAIHDDIRALLKKARAALLSGDASGLLSAGTEAAKTLKEMTYKEEKILFPLSLDTLSDTEWAEIRAGEGELGYALVTPGQGWKPADAGPGQAPAAAPEPSSAAPGGRVPLSTGALTPEQIDLLLLNLHLDVSFVDENDEVRYYSATKERIFPRSPGIVGRKVQNCHPPDSVHVVNGILEAFKSGARDTAEFWIALHGGLVYIRYFAMRDANGSYRGTLEVSQDVTGIRELEGEQRLLDWEN
jgi:hypothetical protein